MAATQGHAWRRGTASGKSKVRNNWSTIPAEDERPKETPRFIRRQRHIEDLQQRHRLLQQQLDLVAAKEERCSELLYRKLADKVPDTFHGEGAATPPVPAPDAGTEYMQTLLDQHEALKHEEVVEEEEGLATARLRNIAMTGCARARDAAPFYPARSNSEPLAPSPSPSPSLSQLHARRRAPHPDAAASDRGARRAPGLVARRPARAREGA